MIIYLTTSSPDDDQITLSTGDLTKLVAVLLAWNPGGFLSIVRLGLIRTFHLKRDEKVWRRIGIGSHIFLWRRHFK